MTRRARAVLFGIVALVLLVLTPARVAHGHKPSDAYLTVVDRDGGLDVRLDVAVRDLDFALELGGRPDGAVTWADLGARREDILEYARKGIDLRRGEEPCTLARASLMLATHSDGPYVVLLASPRCGGATEVTLRYALFFDLDREHRGVFRAVSGRAETVSIVHGGAPPATITLGQGPGLGSIVEQGILHIWRGVDHLLFLLALLVPSVLVRDGRGWKPRPDLRGAAWEVARVVTAFTLAHSITLGLAAMGIVSLPSRFVEATIAASVVLAAANNLRPVLDADRWLIAFVLGLMHGFGFSSTLADLGLGRAALVPVLVGFNAGVEIGQLAIVLVFVPIAFRLRETRAYRTLVLRGGSAVVAAIASVWFLERAFALRPLLPLP